MRAVFKGQPQLSGAPAIVEVVVDEILLQRFPINGVEIRSNFDHFEAPDVDTPIA